MEFLKRIDMKNKTIETLEKLIQIKDETIKELERQLKLAKEQSVLNYPQTLPYLFSQPTITPFTAPVDPPQLSAFIVTCGGNTILNTPNATYTIHNADGSSTTYTSNTAPHSNGYVQTA
jgi:hypothetical protein